MDGRRSETTEEAGVVGELRLYPGLPVGARVISREAWYLDECGVRGVYVGRVLLTSYALGDKTGQDYAMAQLSRGKHATQGEVARAFGVSRCTVNRLCGRLDEEGIGGLVRRSRRDKTPGAVVTKVCRLRREGKRIQEVSVRTGVSTRTVRTILSERGLSPYDRPRARQGTLGEREGESWVEAGAVAEGPGESSSEGLHDEAFPETEGSLASGTGSGVARAVWGRGVGDVHGLERALAPTGRVEEATVIFESAEGVEGAGALLGIAMAGVPLLATAREVYGKLRNGFYGLRCTVLGLLALACLGLKNGESLKGENPVALGRLLGLDRVFEVKTLRRKLRELGWLRQAAEWHRLVSQRWVAEERDRVVTLYVDGHTRAYYGKREVAKGWVARRRLCQPATSDTWVNDCQGAPVLRVTEEAHPALCRALPEILKEVRELVGEGARPTVVFDRGGWSGRTFRQLVTAGFDFVTYQKGPFQPLPTEVFRAHRLRAEARRPCAEGPGRATGKVTTYRLTQDRLTIPGYGEARRIIQLCNSGKQVPLVTNKKGPAAAVVRDLLGRWRQENCFKYMREHYDLDALVDYGYEPVPDREILNPARNLLNDEVQTARNELKKLQSAYAQSRHDATERRRLTTELEKQERRVAALTHRREALPTRVSLSASDRAGEVRLSRDRKLFTDVVKMAAYRADCALVELTDPYLQRNAAEGHAFVRAALRQRADLRVTGNRIEVLFDPMSAPRFTNALTGLCAAVNATHPTFPETHYQLHFSVKNPDQM